MRMAPILLARLLAPLLALSGLAAPAHAQDGSKINFGDNTSGYADNGECDDPRFEGEGMAEVLIASDLRHDAEDCAAGVKAGRLALEPLPAYEGDEPAPTIDEIDFGDDESDFANDGACDDSRFGGRVMASTLIPNDLGHDATDCRLGMAENELVFLSNTGALPEPADLSVDESDRVDLSGIDFGNNKSPFALNGQCDDRRFSGEAMASLLIESDISHDASDCALAVIEGRAVYRRGIEPSGASIDAIDFGDDSSGYSNNLECDDPRFEGDGMAGILLDGDLGHDASDCLAAMEAGEIEYIGEAE